MNTKSPCTIETQTPMTRPCSPAQSWVHEFLEPDQLSASKMRYGRRPLRRGTLILLWMLRVYVVLMIFIVALAIRGAFLGGN
ncbi:MAG: hypothetical protein ABSG59_19015 [Verrucomicrobiota bacterium]|jgi:hypothetical protein